MKEELHLLYSYGEYKEKKRQIWSNVDDFISGDYSRMMTLALKCPRTDEEEEQYRELELKVEKKAMLREFTEKTHELTDKYIGLKNIHDDEERKERYEEIGKMQCNIEVLKEKWDKLWKISE